MDEVPPGPLITVEPDSDDSGYPPKYPTMRPLPEGYVGPDASSSDGDDDTTGELTDTAGITSTDAITSTGTLTATGTITP